MRKPLREALCEVTMLGVSEHERLLEQLRDQHQHTIQIGQSTHPLNSYTCGVHAFQLIGNNDYLDVAGFGLGRTFAGPEFVGFLVQNRMLQEVTSAQAARDDLAIYYFDGRFAHVDRLVSPGRLLSKWGTGHLSSRSRSD
jgi:hypothetical protein